MAPTLQFPLARAHAAGLSVAAALLVASLASAATAAAAEITRIAATVGREAITTSEVELTARTMLKASPEAAQLDADTLRQHALEELIDREIMRSRMKTLGLSVSDAEVDRALVDMLGRAGIPADRIDLMLEREGVSKKEYMARLKPELERRKMIELEVRPHVVVAESAIQRYYEEHRDEFVAPARVKLAELLVAVPEDASSFERDEARQKALDLKKIADSGATPFAELVREHSAGPTAPDGGTIGTFQQGELRPDWADIVFALGEGEVGGPVQSSDGFRLLQAVEVTAGGPQPLEAVKGSIREKLLDGELEDTYKRWLDRIREDVHIERLVTYGAAPIDAPQPDPDDAG